MKALALGLLAALIMTACQDTQPAHVMCAAHIDEHSPATALPLAVLRNILPYSGRRNVTLKSSIGDSSYSITLDKEGSTTIVRGSRDCEKEILPSSIKLNFEGKVIGGQAELSSSKELEEVAAKQMWSVLVAMEACQDIEP